MIAQKPPTQNPQDKKKKNEQIKQQDLSVEDRQLKENIDGHCENLLNNNQPSLGELMELVKSSTRTMTSVPKPFKFLKTFYKPLTEHFQTQKQGEHKIQYASFLSVLSMIFGQKGARSSLYYLLKGKKEVFTEWGHQYVSNLASDIGKQYELRLQNNQPFNELLNLVDLIVPYFVANNAEHDAIDLLLIVDKLQDITTYVSFQNFSKVHMYLAAICAYSTDQDQLIKILTIIYDLSLKMSEYTIALRMAIKLDDHQKIKHIFNECPDQLIKKQLAFNAARQKIFIHGLDEETTAIMSNSKLSKFYLDLAKDLQVHEPKHPKDVFKMHLQQNYRGNNDKAVTLQNIYVNALVNAGLTKDTLMIDDQQEDERKNWVILLKDKEEWQIAAVASLGLLCPWNADTINDMLMPYIDNDGKFIKAGSSLGIGLCCAGINDENDVAFGLLSDLVQNGDSIVRQCSILGLGMAYAGREKEELQDIFVSTIVDTDVTLEESAFAALSLGLTYVGQCNNDVAGAIIQTLMQRDEIELNSHFSKYFGIGLALLFMGQQNKCQATLEMIDMLDHPIKKFIQIMLIGTAYIGSGNVLQVQKMVHSCLSEQKNSETAILALSLIASSEQIGSEMATRILNHILHFGKPIQRRIVPLAYAMLSLSNPKISVVDILYKLSYDTDSQISERSIICLGLVGAGTNNSRIAEIFRKLASYYNKQSSVLFCIRISQGLLYMGKGMVSVQPYYSEKFLLSKVAMSGVLVFLTSMFDIKDTILMKHHYFVYFLALAIYPKSLFVLNDRLQAMPLNVRVGQAVDVVGKAGKPKKITGFQTHTSPVLIGNGERAELASEEYVPIQESVLENFIILKKNPDYIEEEKPRKKTSI